jgi:hypothetical protein
MDMKTEVARLIRHGLPPIVAFAVAKGWIPQEMQQPLIEAGVVLAAFLAALMASRKRDATVSK